MPTRPAATPGTGSPALDDLLHGLLPGDNVVWLVDGIDAYQPRAAAFAAAAARHRPAPAYFRFARHPALLPPDAATVHHVDPAAGFERFVTGILDVIDGRPGPACFVFDCLSDLAADWFSDRMLANFYQIVCPHVYAIRSLACFALLKDRHPAHALDAITGTAQVVLEVFRHDGRSFLQPLKVFERHSPTLYMVHEWVGDALVPVTSSATLTAIRLGAGQPWRAFPVRRPGVWSEMFQQARQALEQAAADPAAAPAAAAWTTRLLKVVATREERLSELAAEFLDLADLVGIMRRMIGSGLIGGKSLGMLLARAALRRADPRWAGLLEEHDSFFIGTDVFYTYLVVNDCWWPRHRLRRLAAAGSLQDCLDCAAEARPRMLQGRFPDDVLDQFREMLDYFGQWPIIVRSSSLLEDSYGNAFSGKYESVFCANQGSPGERLDAFVAAVRTVYASTLGADSIHYRLDRGLMDRDEQMALLVQRVSGEMHGSLFFPQLAGVGFSFNPFVWHHDIDPRAGVLRLVFGLGTRAVERADDDYTRLVALNAPRMRPEAGPDREWRYAQRRVDVLDLAANQLASRDYAALAALLPEARCALFSSEPGPAAAPDFGRLLADTGFVPVMRELLETLARAYRHPVDVEFTANFLAGDRFQVNVVQCRPFQVRIMGEGGRIEFPAEVPAADQLIASNGPILGGGMTGAIDWLVFVPPAVYARLPMSDRYSVARAIGRVTAALQAAGARTILLLGPGRWGTSMPALGVPVSFAEICRVTVLGEIATMHDGLIPDVSLGTHFFNDLVEADICYFAVSPGRGGHCLDEQRLGRAPNQLATLLPHAARHHAALRVLRAADLAATGRILLHADAMQQRLVCYRCDEPR